MTIKKISVLAVLLCMIQPSVRAEDTRSGRVIPLAEKACFGYTQPIGDRICLFDGSGSQIADYSVYYQTDTLLNGDAFVVDDDFAIYFYNSQGECFLTLPSGTEYAGNNLCTRITYKSDGGYEAKASDGETDFITDEELEKAAGDESIYGVRYDDRFLIKINENTWRSVTSRKKFSELADDVYSKYRSSLVRKEDDGNYIISKSVDGTGSDYGVMSPDGKIIVSPKYSVIGEKSEGVYVVWSSNRYDRPRAGITSVLGTDVDYKYEDAGSKFSEGLLGVSTSSFSGYIDHDENTVIDLSDRVVYEFGDFEDGKAQLRLRAGKSGYWCEYIDKEGNTLIDSREFTANQVTSMPCRKNVYYLEDFVILQTSETSNTAEKDAGFFVSETKRPYYYTDITTLINGKSVECYATDDGTMLISADTFGKYGFDVSYSDAERQLFVNKSDKVGSSDDEYEDFEGNAEHCGEIAGYSMTSDISVYVNGQYIESEIIGDSLFIDANTLCALPMYGDDDYFALNYKGISKYLMKCEYDNNERILFIT